MILFQNERVGCEQCIRGHRAADCEHLHKYLISIKSRGRPASKDESVRLRIAPNPHVVAVNHQPIESKNGRGKSGTMKKCHHLDPNTPIEFYKVKLGKGFKLIGPVTNFGNEYESTFRIHKSQPLNVQQPVYNNSQLNQQQSIDVVGTTKLKSPLKRSKTVGDSTPAGGKITKPQPQFTATSQYFKTENNNNILRSPVGFDISQFSNSSSSVSSLNSNFIGFESTSPTEPIPSLRTSMSSDSSFATELETPNGTNAILSSLNGGGTSVNTHIPLTNSAYTSLNFDNFQLHQQYQKSPFKNFQSDVSPPPSTSTNATFNYSDQASTTSTTIPQSKPQYTTTSSNDTEGENVNSGNDVDCYLNLIKQEQLNFQHVLNYHIPATHPNDSLVDGGAPDNNSNSNEGNSELRDYNPVDTFNDNGFFN